MKKKRKTITKSAEKKHFTLFGIIVFLLGLIIFFYSFNTSLAYTSAFIALLGALFFAISILFPGQGNEDFFVFMDSFKRMKFNALFVMLIDLMFILAMYLLFRSWDIVVSFTAENFGGVFFYIILILLIISLIALFLMLWALFQGFNWTVILKAKFTPKYFTRFLWLSALLFLMWLIPVLFLLNYFAQTDKWPFYAVIIWLAIAYYSMLSYVFFIKEHEVLSAISNAFSIGTRNFHLFIFPILFVLFSFTVINIAGYLLSGIPETAYNVLLLLLSLFSLAWMRYYAVDIVNEVKRKHIR